MRRGSSRRSGRCWRPGGNDLPAQALALAALAATTDAEAGPPCAALTGSAALGACAAHGGDGDTARRRFGAALALVDAAGLRETAGIVSRIAYRTAPARTLR